MSELSAYEAIYQFTVWLSNHQTPITFSSIHDSAKMTKLISEFCKANGIKNSNEGNKQEITTPNKINSTNSKGFFNCPNCSSVIPEGGRCHYCGYDDGA